MNMAQRKFLGSLPVCYLCSLVEDLYYKGLPVGVTRRNIYNNAEELKITADMVASVLTSRLIKDDF